MRLTLIKPVLCLFIVFISYYAQAIEINNLYQVRVDVQGQSKSEKDEALKEAMQQVLVKVSGKAATLQNGVIQSQVSSPNQYIKTYSYHKNEDSNSFWLKVDFAKNKIDALLIQQKQSLWGASRPLLLVWLVDESTQNKRIVNLENKTIKSYLKRAMDERGLPITWPYSDEIDTKKLNFDNRMLSNNAILAASERYNTDVVLSGRIQKQFSIWRFDGRLSQSERDSLIRVTSESRFGLSRKIAAIVAEKLANQYAISIHAVSERERKIVKVVGVKSFKAYHSLIDYLKNKTGINDIMPIRIKDTNLIVELELSASWSKVESSIRLDKKLIPDALHVDQWRWYQ